MERKIVISDFSGAIASTSEKKDIPNSARFVKGMNPFEDPAFITLSRKATKVSGTTVVTLPHWAQDGSPWSTDRYFYDSGGKIYKETSASSWSVLRTVSGGGGEGFLVFDNYLYYPQATELGRYGPLDGTPAFQDSFSGWWIATQLQDTRGGTGAADYVPPTAIDETATHRQTFVGNKDPIVSITIDVDVVGSGDWTVTVHDAANNSIGAKTIVNASVSVADITFTFASPLRIETGETYHFHVTSTVADGGVDTDVATDLEGAEYTIQYGTLIDATFHPGVEHLNLSVFGNERYLATFDQATYSPNKIVFPAGFEVRALAKQDEFVVAECFKGASVQSAEEARRYYWDGISPTFNFYNDVKVGPCHALSTNGKELIGVYGHKGAIYKGDDFRQVSSKVPKLARGKYVEVYPGAITEFENRTLVGYAQATDDNSALEKGIYEHGREDNKLPEVLNMSYLISTGTTQGSTTEIGLVKVLGTDIYIGSRDGASTYQVDKIALGDGALASGAVWESLIFDAGDPEKYMQAVKVEIVFEALTTGQSVTPKYKLDRTSSFTNGTAASTVGDTRVDVFINTLCKEAEFGWGLASSSNTFPKITSIKFVYDDLLEEGEV